MKLPYYLSGLGVAVILAATTQPAAADFSFSDIPNPFCSLFTVGCPEPPPPPPPPPMMAPVAAEPAPVKHVRHVHRKKVVKKKAAEDAAAPAPAAPEPAAK